MDAFPRIFFEGSTPSRMGKIFECGWYDVRIKALVAPAVHRLLEAGVPDTAHLGLARGPYCARYAIYQGAN
jgi:hypothetical protein